MCLISLEISRAQSWIVRTFLYDMDAPSTWDEGRVLSPCGSGGNGELARVTALQKKRLNIRFAIVQEYFVLKI